MKVLVADDHVLVREGIKYTLQKIFENLTVYEACDGNEVKRQISMTPDIQLVLLDLYMPHTDGFSLLATLCKVYPNLPVVMLSASEDADHMRKAIDWGASGYIPKSASEEEMCRALNMVMKGGTYVPDYLASNGGAMPMTSEKQQPAVLKVPELTSRQRDVLQLLGEGRTNKEIAKLLDLSEYTIKIHVTAILKLFDATNRTQAVIEAKRMGLLSSSN